MTRFLLRFNLRAVKSEAAEVELNLVHRELFQAADAWNDALGAYYSLCTVPNSEKLNGCGTVPAMQFKLGDRVQWIRAASDRHEYDKGSIAGVVRAIIPDDQSLEEFTMYEVKFEFGYCTLYGTELRAFRQVSTSR